jgi:hypothetical protein
MNSETISIHDMLADVQRERVNWERLFVEAMEDGCTPAQYRHRLNCKQGLETLLAALVSLEEVTA